MKILITAGATQTPIDQVRAITNIFKGTTGRHIALEAHMLGHEVTLLTSSPDANVLLFKELGYRTYDELYTLMEDQIKYGNYDVIIHSAAVSDYKVVGVYSRPFVCSNDTDGTLQITLDSIENSGKVAGSYNELFLRLVPTEKIVDKIRDPWGFKGILVKFKLQVGLTDEELLQIAQKSRETSHANIVVANCLEWARERAYLCHTAWVDPVLRGQLPKALLERVAEEWKQWATT
jgi:phosphopantothenate-cysteine ligase/phosphopantothenoylcysteine decarboxylase/phosphopantothenate--cysteine ligase